MPSRFGVGGAGSPISEDYAVQGAEDKVVGQPSEYQTTMQRPSEQDLPAASGDYRRHRRDR